MSTEEDNLTEKPINKNSKKKKENLSAKIMQRINGDIMPDKFLKRNFGVIVLIFFLIILYEHMGYQHQQKMLSIVHLKKELTDLKYQTLSIQSELMKKSLRSEVEVYSANKSNHLEMKTTPRYIIK